MAEQSSPGIKAWQVVVSLVGAAAVVYLIGALFNWYWPWWAYALMFAFCMVTILGRMISDTEKHAAHRAVMEMNERDKARDKAQE